MARYQRPSDPRKSQQAIRDRPPAKGDGSSEPLPWLWLGLGILVTLIGLAIAGVLLAIFLFRQPLQVLLPTPTIIRLTAAPGAAATSTPRLPTATPIPTFTPPSTPDLSIAPETITVGYYAEVANTENIGVSLRGGPSTDNIRLELVPEGVAILVIGGPEEGSGFIWWQVRLENGTEGWVAGDFLVPGVAPN